MRIEPISLLAVALALGSASATEFFVAPGGGDTAVGRP